MTSLSLLIWIALGAAVQLAIFLGIAFWRHWKSFLTLQALSGDGSATIDNPETEAGVEADVEAWQGFRFFKVVRKEFEDARQSICSFYLEPADGMSRPLPSFRPGQFLTFRLDIPAQEGTTHQVVRCYSLSDAPGQSHYRISIKRVPPPTGTDYPPGRSSAFFHDQVLPGSSLAVKAPSGHFHIDRSNAPVALIAGGIGITPMMSMLNACIQEQPDREVWLFYGVRNSHEVIMNPHLDALAAAHPNFHLRLCFSNPLATDKVGRDYQSQGRIDVPLLRMQLPLKPYHFYVCGPTPMMETLVPALEDWGIPDSRIHFEAFACRKPARFRRGQRDIGRFRLSIRRLRHLPDNNSIRRGDLSPGTRP